MSRGDRQGTREAASPHRATTPRWLQDSPAPRKGARHRQGQPSMRRRAASAPPSSSTDVICRSAETRKGLGQISLVYRFELGAQPLQLPGALGGSAIALGRCDDYHRSCLERREHPRRRRNSQPPVEQDPRQWTATMHVARCKQRIVDEQRSRADSNRIDFGPHRMRMPLRVFRGEWGPSHPHARSDDYRGLSRLSRSRTAA